VTSVQRDSVPAPKKFNRAPAPPPPYTPRRSSVSGKGRYAVVPPPPTPHIDEEDALEVSVDEVSVVVGKVSKYEARALNAHVDPSLTIDLDELDAPDEDREPVEPIHPTPIALGEWRTESTLEGSHYHRKDSRRP
jgi:hypothetical protein